MSIKGIIFDFDGTLFDSMGIWETAGANYLASLGIQPEENLHKKLKVMTLLQSAEYLKDKYAIPLSIEEIVAGENKTVEDFYFFHALPKEHVINFLSSLKEKGVKMCIATASVQYQVEVALKRCGMLKYFDAIFTCSAVGCGKDVPYIYEHARKFMELEKSETAVFEDAYYAAKTAKDAGYFVVGIYDKYEKQIENLKNIADVYINSFSETEKLNII